MGPLADVRILDLTDESGAFATRLLADLGAEVVRVESPDAGRLRRLAPFLGGEEGPERSLQHLYHDAGKQSVVVDRSTTEGDAALDELLGWADAVVETERLDHARVVTANPRSVHVTITPFGLDGPRSEWAGNDLTAVAAGGLAWVCGKPGDPPNQPGADQGHKMAGLAAAAGTVMALRGLRQQPDAAGVHLDISAQLATAQATVQTSHPTHWLWNGRVPGGPGLTTVHQCSDGQWVTLMVRPDRLGVFLDWCREAGLDVPDDEAELHDAFGGTTRLALLIRELVSRYPRDEFFERAWEIDLLGLPVNTLPDLETCDHLVATQAFVDVDHGDLHPPLPFPRSPLDAVAVPLRRAPRLGEHTSASRPRRPHRPAAAPLDLGRALDGIRVVDFCWVLAGPLGTRILADFGAEVIRVEAGARSYPDHFPADAAHPDLGAFHNTVNTQKRSVTIDPRTDRGRELLLDLITRSDVVTNNYRPGSFEEMGFGYDVLRERNPGIISIHMPGCGRQGPWRDRGSFGNMIAGASGLSWLTGFPGRSPRGLGVAHPDFTGPYLLAMAAVAAVQRREQNGGVGEELEVNQLTGTLGLVGVEWLQYASTGEAPPMRANRDPNWCPHGIYPSAGEDEWVAVAAGDDEAWRRLCDVIDRPDLRDDPALATLAGRKAAEDRLDEAIRAWTAGRDKWTVADELQRHGVAAAPVEHLADAADRDPVLSRWMERVRQPSHPDIELVTCGEAIQEAGRYRPLRRAPMVGEHNDAVLRDVLGLDDDEIARLADDGVVRPTRPPVSGGS